MDEQMQKKLLISLCVVAGVMVLGAVGIAVWNSEKCRSMRAVRRTNRILNRVGDALCQASEMSDECL